MNLLKHCAAVLILLWCNGCLSTPQIQCDDGICDASATCARIEADVTVGTTLCASDTDLALCREQIVGASCGANRFCIATSAGALCVDSICGDGIRTSDEICDDGNAVNGDGCSRDCLSDETCGNGIIDGIVGEQCDDGATSGYGRSGDGCNSTCAIEGYQWSDVSQLAVTQRSGHVMAYDAARGTVVLFGGRSAANDFDPNTWEFDGVRWSRWRGVSVSPTPVRDAAMTYDSERKVMVLTGGQRETGTFNDHVWEFDGVAWVDRGSVPALARMDHAMVYDTLRRKIVVYGGTRAASGGDLADVWEYDGQQWSKNMAVAPPARTEAAASYDELRHRLVLVGGLVNQVPVGETWEFDGTVWLERKDLPTAHPAVADHAMYFDATTNLVVSVIPNPLLQIMDSWVFDGQTWMPAESNNSASACLGHAVAFDRGRNVAILFGGSPEDPLNDDSITSEISSSNGMQDWRRLDFPANPITRFGASSAFDFRRGIAVMFGGGFASLPLYAETWEYANAQWQLRQLDTSPPATIGATMVYDAARGVMVLFGGVKLLVGGVNSAISNDTWEYDGASWTQRGFAVAPPARSAAAATYDTRTSTMIVAGGLGLVSPRRDTWLYDGVAWTQQGDLPIAVSEHLMVYDPGLNRTVLFGGKTGPASADINPQTFAFDGVTWQSIAAALPFRAVGLAATYDPTTGHVVAQSQLETWYLDGASWRRRTTLSSVASIQSPSLLYDTVHRALLMIGVGPGPFRAETRVWRLGFALDSGPPDLCSATRDTDGDGLIGCGDGTDVANPTRNADPDCYGRCFPLCALDAGALPAACDVSQPHCGDGVCNPSLEGPLLCPEDCPPS